MFYFFHWKWSGERYNIQAFTHHSGLLISHWIIYFQHWRVLSIPNAVNILLVIYMLFPEQLLFSYIHQSSYNSRLLDIGVQENTIIKKAVKYLKSICIIYIICNVKILETFSSSMFSRCLFLLIISVKGNLRWK